MHADFVRERRRAISGARHLFVIALAVLLGGGAAHAATTVPNDVKLPGTQPGEVSGIQSVSKYDNCHGHFEPAGEPWFN